MNRNASFDNVMAKAKPQQIKSSSLDIVKLLVWFYCQIIKSGSHGTQHILHRPLKNGCCIRILTLLGIHSLYKPSKVCWVVMMMIRWKMSHQSILCVLSDINTFVWPVLVNVDRGGHFKYVTGSPSSRLKGCHWFKRLSVAVSEEHDAKMPLS